MRVRDFPAQRIRETVAEVEAHLEASGEDPREAFGAPSEFVADLDAARAARPPRLRGARAASLAATGAGSLLVALFALKGLGALLSGGEAEVALGELLGLGVLLAGVAVLWGLFVAHADGRRALWPVAAAFAAFSLSGGVLAALLERPVLFSTPGWTLVAAAGVLAVGVAFLARPEPLRPRDD